MALFSRNAFQRHIKHFELLIFTYFRCSQSI